MKPFASCDFMQESVTPGHPTQARAISVWKNLNVAADIVSLHSSDEEWGGRLIIELQSCSVLVYLSNLYILVNVSTYFWLPGDSETGHTSTVLIIGLAE